MFYMVEIDTVYNTPDRIVGISTNKKESIPTVASTYLRFRARGSIG